MPNYIYRGKTPDGKITRGSLEAPDKKTALESLQSKGILVISIDGAEEVVKKLRPALKRLKFRTSLQDLALFARQLSTLLDAGIPLLRCLQIIKEQVESKPLYIALEQIIKDIEAGRALSDALAKHPKLFSEFWINIISTGETSGQLPFVLAQLAQYIEMSLYIQRRLRTALIYPAALSAFAFIAIAVFIIVIVPIFANLYEAFGAELPFLTSLIINISTFVRKFSLLVFLILFSFILFLWHFRRSARGRLFIDNLKLKIPIFKGFFYNIVLQRFSSGLAILLRGGVPIIYALDVVSRAVVNKIYESIINRAKERIKDGEALAITLTSYPREFPPLIINMIKVGEESGALVDMLARAAEYYRERIDIFVARLPYIIEPIIILTIGVIVGIIVVAMFLPIFGLATVVK